MAGRRARRGATAAWAWAWSRWPCCASSWADTSPRCRSSAPWWPHGALAGAIADGDIDGDAQRPLGRRRCGGVGRAAGRRATASGRWRGRARADAVTARRDGGGTWRLSGRSDPVVRRPDGRRGGGVRRGTTGPRRCSPLAPDDGDRPRRAGHGPHPQPGVARRSTTAPALVARRRARRRRRCSTAPSRRCAPRCSAPPTAVLDMTVQYAKDRVQFGRPIGSFQAVKHRCADMLVDVEGMRSAAYYAAWAVGAGDPDASAAASAAKVWCSDAARRVMASGLQVHGGIGFTWEHDLHLFLKRSQLDQVSFGDATYHRDRLARILRPRAEAGLPVL